MNNRTSFRIRVETYRKLRYHKKMLSFYNVGLSHHARGRCHGAPVLAAHLPRQNVH